MNRRRRIYEGKAKVLYEGLRTRDIAAPGQNVVSTADMGGAIIKAMQQAMV